MLEITGPRRLENGLDMPKKITHLSRAQQYDKI